MATKKIDNDFATMSVADKLALIAQLQEQIKAEAAAERAKFVERLEEIKAENEQALIKVNFENQARLDTLKAEAEAAGITDLFAEETHENGKYYLVNPANPAERYGMSGKKPEWYKALLEPAGGDKEKEKEIKDGLEKVWVPF